MAKLFFSTLLILTRSTQKSLGMTFRETFLIVFNLSKNRLKSLINRLQVIVIPFLLCYQLSVLFTTGVPRVSFTPKVHYL